MEKNASLMGEESSVFKRRETTDALIGNGVYNLIIGMVLCWGFLINYLMVKYIPVETVYNIDGRLFLLGYFVLCFGGVYLFEKSSNPFVSFLGYNLVVIPFGFIINIVVSQYDSSLVMDAIRITGIVTAIMMLAGVLFPEFFKRISGTLTIALISVIIVELIEIFILGYHYGIIDWIVVIIFCGYIGYDWGRANVIPKTVDNAIDSAAALYMDIINLFLRILRILGRKR